jgi:16S rRNA A1518/A1519 N6-dimethyltransferase RsmA/KsgA/DIM1 with predicted DNA glycosylase/AP lyase activity
MYGGLKENVVQRIVERTNMSTSSVFLDVGSGIGQVSSRVDRKEPSTKLRPADLSSDRCYGWL